MSFDSFLIKEKHKKLYSHYLAVGEKMTYFTGLSRIYLFRRLVWWFVFPGIILIIAITVAICYLFKVELLFGLLSGYFLTFLASLIRIYFIAKGTQYILTDRRLLIQRGYFNVSLTSAAYDKITHVEVKQGIAERYLFKYGRVIIHTAGSKNREIILRFIDSPIKFKNLLEKLIDESRFSHVYEPRWRRNHKTESLNSEKDIKKINFGD